MSPSMSGRPKTTSSFSSSLAALLMIATLLEYVSTFIEEYPSISSSKEVRAEPSKRASTTLSFTVSSSDASPNRDCAEGSFFAVNSLLPTSSPHPRPFYPPLSWFAPELPALPLL